jgi:dCTP deaminase
MTIRPDHWIREKCTMPTFVISQTLPIYDKKNSLKLTYKKLDTFVHLTEEEAKNIVDGSNYSPTSISIPSADGSNVNPYAASYRQLTDEEKAAFEPMIAPFTNGQVRYVSDPFPSSTGEDDSPRKIVSYGLSSFGYDVRLDRKFKIFTNINSTVIDPLDFDHDSYVEHEGDWCIIPPNSYVLGVSMEYFIIPRNVMVVCLGKSTYARCGAIVNVTPIEAGFRGNVVIEISNASPLPLKIHAGQGISQFLFFESDTECEVSYADRGGKYQGQTDIVTAKV